VPLLFFCAVSNFIGQVIVVIGLKDSTPLVAENDKLQSPVQRKRQFMRWNVKSTSGSRGDWSSLDSVPSSIRVPSRFPPSEHPSAFAHDLFVNEDGQVFNSADNPTPEDAIWPSWEPIPGTADPH